MQLISEAITAGSLEEIAERDRREKVDARLIAKTIVAAGSITPNRATRRAMVARERKMRSRGKVGA